MKVNSKNNDSYPIFSRTGRIPRPGVHPLPWVSTARIFFVCAIILSGCAGTVKKTTTGKTTPSLAVGTILKTRSGSFLSYTELIRELEQVQIIYVGEKHTDPMHHTIQRNIIKDIHNRHPLTIVGMEMFDRSYQPVLDRWSSGAMDYEAFLRRTHWYANWRMDDRLYEDILKYLKEKNIRLIGLNIPFHIPSKIAIGGIDSLSEAEKRWLPKTIDISNPQHRQYVKEIFELHAVKGIDAFENFYAAQCVWEDIMAETIAAHLGTHKMVVIAGNGHIIKHFGIPDRAHKRTGASFRTVYLAPEGAEVEPSFADYIWITPVKK